MAQPARKPDPAPAEPATRAEPATPQLRARHLRAASNESPAGGDNQPHLLQGRIARAFATRPTTRLEALLMRLIIIASACLVVTRLLLETAFFGRLH